MATDLSLNENQIYKWFWDAQQKEIEGNHPLLNSAESCKGISTTVSDSPRECGAASSADPNHQKLYPKNFDEFGGYSKRHFVRRTIIINSAAASANK